MKKNRLVWLVLFCLLIFGLIREPYENRLRRELTQSRMLLPVLGHSAVSNLTQSALMGTLGGMRSLLATYFLLESYRHFENYDWEENRRALLFTTYLEPYVESHWVTMVWNRGINAPAWLEVRSNLPEFEKKLRFNEYTLDAIELGKAGLEQNPGSVGIRVQIAEVYREKMEDMCGAAEMYRQLMSLEGAPQYSARFYGYFLSECPGREKQAYDHLIDLYWESESNHLPTLIKKIRILQEYLSIPHPLWIRERDPDTSRKKNRRMRRLLPGGIVLP